MTNAAAVAKHFRNRLKAAGIKAKCHVDVACGSTWLRISTPTYEYEFTPEEQIEICNIAIANGLTLARGMKIDAYQGTYTKGVTFVIPNAVLAADWVQRVAERYA